MTDNDATQTRQDDATEELRKLLDERGVEWGSYDEFEPRTQWEAHDGAFVYWARERNGMLLVESTAPEKCSLSMTAEQAIAATLGADEYAIEHNVDGSYECPTCGCVVDYDVRGDDERIITMDDYVIPFNFCPKCGAEVVYE